MFASLASLATAPQGRRRLPEIVDLPLSSVATWVGCSTRTTKRRLAELRAHGWIAASRVLVAGGRSGKLRAGCGSSWCDRSTWKCLDRS